MPSPALAHHRAHPIPSENQTMIKTADLKPGDAVRYHRDWLRSVGAVAGEIPHRRGRVLAVTRLSRSGPAYVQVAWDGKPEPATVLGQNLEARPAGAKRWQGVDCPALS